MAKKPKLKSRKLPPCSPIDVPAIWKRIEAAVGALAPDLVDNLAAGATDKQIAAFEKAIGRKLPEEVRASFLAHNGQRGEWGHPVFSGFRFGSIKWAQNLWDAWLDMADETAHDKQLQNIGTSVPKNAVRRDYANRNWVQLAEMDGSNYYGVDFAPDSKGVLGQVISFGRDEPDKEVLAWSWGWLLNDLAEELEAGNFRYQADGDTPGLVIINPAPPSGFLANFGVWSKAKTAGKRPFDPLTESALAPLRADSNVMQLAKVIAKSCDFGSLPILADALEEAGCTDARFLAHCRQPGEHGCGCWAVNLLLGTAPEFVAAG
jgi:cell wall assembly regulator SMI1